MTIQPDKTVIITGGNSGLGYQCARVLALRGEWHIVIASRNKSRIDRAITSLQEETGHQAFTAMEMDLASLASIRRFAQNYTSAALPPLQALVCNAGVSPMNNSQTADGYDFIFGVNHLGHYLLIHLLAAQLADDGRVVLVSSGTHIPEHKLARRAGVPTPRYTSARDLACQEEAAEGMRVDNPRQRYSTSKLCNVLCAYELARQFQSQGRHIGVYALDPGLMPGTGLVRDIPAPLQTIFASVVRFADRWVAGIRLPELSGQHLARLVEDPALNGRTALYFDGDKEAQSSADSYDRAKAADLWNTSSQLVELAAADTSLPLVV